MKILYLVQYYSPSRIKALNIKGEFSQGGLNKIKPFISIISKAHDLLLISTGYTKSNNFKYINRCEESYKNNKNIKVIYPAYLAIRYISFLTITLSMIIECIRQKPDAIIFYNFRIWTLLPAVAMKVLFKTKIICQYEDGYHVLYSKLSPRFYYFNILYLIGKKFCDGFTLVNSRLLDIFPAERSVVIPFILNNYDNQKQNVIYDLKGKDKVNLLYAGSLDYERGADLYLDAALMMKNNSRLHFNIAGKGYLEEKIITASNNNDNISFLGYLNESDMNIALERMDILVNPQKLGLYFAVHSFPSKIKTYLQMAKPIISTAFKDICGYKVSGIYFMNDDTAKSLVDRIEVILDKDIKIDYELYFQAFDENNTERKFISFINRIVYE